jgi:hypothetical protein
MKVILKECKIYGYDNTIFKTFQNNGQETKQYSVALYISDADKAVIDSYLYGKVTPNAEGENVFYGKSKQPIPIFDAEKVKIEKPVNEVFIADVSILIDEFVGKDGENIRYSKCLGIKYIKKIENEQPKLPAKTYTDFDDIFADETELVIPATIAPPLQEIVNNDPLNVDAPAGGVDGSDLPF